MSKSYDVVYATNKSASERFADICGDMGYKDLQSLVIKCTDGSRHSQDELISDDRLPKLNCLSILGATPNVFISDKSSLSILQACCDKCNNRCNDKQIRVELNRSITSVSLEHIHEGSSMLIIIPMGSKLKAMSIKSESVIIENQSPLKLDSFVISCKELKTNKPISTHTLMVNSCVCLEDLLDNKITCPGGMVFDFMDLSDQISLLHKIKEDERYIRAYQIIGLIRRVDGGVVNMIQYVDQRIVELFAIRIGEMYKLGHKVIYI
jgi:hypothetical protein